MKLKTDPRNDLYAMTFAEIAEELRCSEASVDQTYRRAMKKLRALFERCHFTKDEFLD